MGGTQELCVSCVVLSPEAHSHLTATLDYAKTVIVRAEPNGQPRRATTIPPIPAHLCPGGEALMGRKGLFRGIQQTSNKAADQHT